MIKDKQQEVDQVVLEQLEFLQNLEGYARLAVARQTSAVAHIVNATKMADLAEASCLLRCTTT